MEKQIYTIYDSISQIYWHPFYAHNHQDAMRVVSNLVNIPGENDIHLHPDDFKLYHIGVFNDQKSEIILQAITPITFICNCEVLVTKPQEVETND